MGKHQSEGFLQAVRRPKSYKEFIAKLCPFALQCAGKAILQLRFSFFWNSPENNRVKNNKKGNITDQHT